MADIRPALRYHGAKWVLGSWICEHLPPHKTYVEPFGGSAAVLLQKPRSYAEIYNEIDGEIVNFFKVLRDQSVDLEAVCRLTPFSRREYYDARYVQDACNDVERARRTVIRSYMGFGSNSITQSSGFRRDSNRSGSTPARDWLRWPDRIEALAERLSGVVIENGDAVEIMSHFDGPETLHYVDPPYLSETRTANGGYRFDMASPESHEALAETLKGLEGAVVLSGYPSGLYDCLFAGWERVERNALADGAAQRVECLWLNERASRGKSQQDMFAEFAA